ncbi:unnamed protein product [Adineta steineri]|uniref:Uncharacterized protein n=1 Tax=Adineta steineri TaxID=433720 RepID=A0A815QUM4_9BILA|nr:unnamed protein product [Adineta steineri]CAF3979837.1 unnamed protein product [Adineta steineri]
MTATMSTIINDNEIVYNDVLLFPYDTMPKFNDDYDNHDFLSTISTNIQFNIDPYNIWDYLDLLGSDHYNSTVPDDDDDDDDDDDYSINY